MIDCIETKEIVVLVQENGIIRNKNGRFLARLDDEIEFDGEHLVEEKMYSTGEVIEKVSNALSKVFQLVIDDKSVTEFDIEKWIKENL